jgi:hypothetical protein
MQLVAHLPAAEAMANDRSPNELLPSPSPPRRGSVAAADVAAACRRPGPAPRAGAARRRRRGGGASGECRHRGTWTQTWAAATLALLNVLFAVAGEEPFWSSAAPAQVLVGRRLNVSVVGSGFMVGARDYYCRFETAFVNPRVGEFEARDSPLTILSPDQAQCTTPPWDLPATETVLKVIKAFGTIRKKGHQLAFRFLQALDSCEPSSGKANGAETITIAGHGFCPQSLCPGSTYVSAFSGHGGRQAVSEPCTVHAFPGGHRLVCQTPRWAFPAEETRISILKEGELVAGECEIMLACLAANEHVRGGVRDDCTDAVRVHVVPGSIEFVVRVSPELHIFQPEIELRCRAHKHFHSRTGLS